MKILAHFLLILSMAIFYGCPNNTGKPDKPAKKTEPIEEPIKKLSLNEVWRKIQLTVESPKTGEMIKTNIYRGMQGEYVGDIPEGFKIWILAHDGQNYFLMYPSATVTPNGWSQRNIKLDTLGNWELMVCLADSNGSNWFEQRATVEENFSGFSDLPDGAKILETVNIERK